ncbi:hypothetical protein CIHG_07608 [Coccidioides immitis H538.4]|uniref:Uncharacterized protein n=1 Tax=Coccidioides immitis H538.4 TaxID=396776 RepID=A0A0J8RXN9_COCIT|nr:hypothetical protein CIHG_07608 [Coccidioides immitis H538.4]
MARDDISESLDGEDIIKGMVGIRVVALRNRHAVSGSRLNESTTFQDTSPRKMPRASETCLGIWSNQVSCEDAVVWLTMWTAEHLAYALAQVPPKMVRSHLLWPPSAAPISILQPMSSAGVREQTAPIVAPMLIAAEIATAPRLPSQWF